MKVWVTNHCLTKGILEVEVEGEPPDYAPGMVSRRVKNGYTECFHGEGKNWHRTLDGAKKRAEEVRLAKIASLKKSIAKLEKLKF